MQGVCDNFPCEISLMNNVAQGTLKAELIDQSGVPQAGLGSARVRENVTDFPCTPGKPSVHPLLLTISRFVLLTKHYLFFVVVCIQISIDMCVIIVAGSEIRWR